MPRTTINTEPTEDTEIDGEPLGQRVERMKRELFEKELSRMMAGQYNSRNVTPRGRVTPILGQRRFRSDDN